jgi:flagellar basal-body rod modification protein FlgD
MSTGSAASTNSAANSLATAASTSATAKNETARKTIAQNFDAFLSLLTTQLRNQNPLEPLDANQFTQQLVQFSGVEQQLKSNDLLASISNNLNGGANGANGSSTKLNAASAASLIGTRVSVDANKARLTRISGPTEALPQGAYETKYPVTVLSDHSNYTVSITDDAGKEVYAGKWTPPATGEQTFKWDGKKNSYELVDTSKSYTITVTGETVGGKKNIMSNERSGNVESVDLSGLEETVQFGGYSVPLSQIKKVSKALI